MKSFFALAFIGAASAAEMATGMDGMLGMAQEEHQFFDFIVNFGKSYSTIEEYQFRLAQFKRAHYEIKAHNDAGESSFQLGHNHMSDWTEEEYKSILTYKSVEEFEDNLEYHPETYSSTGIDWRNHNGHSYVNAIKDQGQCGSCWAFSTIASVENHWSVNHGQLYSLAEQQLVDCETHCYGCNGGNAYYGFVYFESHYAIAESTYKYTARDGTCKYNSYSHTSVKTKGNTSVSRNSSTQMKSALNSGILSVAIEADKSVFQRYSSGIFDSSSCGTKLDHATNVVGWGSSNGTEYWIMRNSWGKSWGESGYMRLAITSGAGICGIQSEPSYPKM